ncbi:hypothetical protein LCGC14_0397250 [marine sediment metagenome]|uniref:Uncharacterized protein n=1 Tax=marine sediment metagenome TaxID=412755 RepID=A0A0F9TFZ9_9ZZZZ
MDEVRKVAREEVERAVEPIRTSLWGRKHPSGTGRVSAEGMEGQLKEVHDLLTNGGIPRAKMALRNKVYVALLTVVGSGVFLLLNTWVVSNAASP